MFINEKFLVKVKELPEYLPVPRLRRPSIKEDKCESLDELEIISIQCGDLNEL